MKKISILITVAILISTVAGGAIPLRAEEEEPQPILETCSEFENAFTEIVEGNKNYVSAMMDEPKLYYKHIDFRIDFEETRNAYHDYVKCIFDQAVVRILGSAGGDTEGIMSTNSPNFIDALPDWLKPDLACLDESKLSEILADGKPANLLLYILPIYNEYVIHLELLYRAVLEESGYDLKDANFTDIVVNNAALKLIVQNEIQDALVAIDSTFISIKELRQAFMMHVHFQCMLKNLEFYRRALENMRSVISVMPALLEDASMHK